MSTATQTPPRPEKHTAKSLFAKHSKVYPKAVTGFFRRLKWAAVAVLLAIYYILPWIRWDRGPDAPDQAVLLDMANRRFYLFFVELWPQQIYYLTGALVLAALGLFMVTAMAGRVWCGYACPQTVWTDLYQWVERRIEGDRNERIRLDQAPWSFDKLRRKALTNLIWLLIAVVTGGAWIFYFVDAPTFMRDLLQGEIGSTALTFIGIFTATTYLLAGYAREQVCLYMCPWPRFQAAMMDEESMIVTYEQWRGENRAHLRKAQSWEERAKEGSGDCIDCYACVQVCPTGVDIRGGLQMGCIGCGLCIDACDEVMTKIERPTKLVRFDTEVNQVTLAAGGQPVKFHLLRSRTLIYAALMAAVTGLMVAGLAFRADIDISILRDRAPLYVALADGSVRNGYTFKISNMTRDAREYTLNVEGLDKARLSVAGETQGDPMPVVTLTAPPDTVATYRILVTAPHTSLHGASMPLNFHLRATSGDSASHHSVFMGPEN